MYTQPIILNSNINKVQRPNFGNLYKPNTLFHKINPVFSSMDNLFERSVTISRICWWNKKPQLSNYIKEIKTVGWQNSENLMWDINKDNRQKYVIIMHGLSHNISSLQDLYADILQKTDFAILAPEYSGLMHNCKEKTYLSPKNLLKDATTGLEYLQQKGIENKNIYVMGHSFGGFVATELAEKHKDLGGLILVSTTDSFNGKVESISNGFMQLIPKKTRKFVQNSSISKLLLSFIFSTKKHLKKVSIPTDFIHSNEDNIVKIQNVIDLSSKCKKLKSFTILKEGGHKMDKVKINTIVNLLNNKS